MAALDDTATANPFDQIGGDAALSPAPQAAPASPVAPAPANTAPTAEAAPASADSGNLFDGIGGDIAPAPSFAQGFLHRAERDVAPLIAGAVAAAPGASAGAELGAFGGPLAPVTVPVGGFIGGVAGSILGSGAAEKAQDFVLSKLPDSWVDALGQSERQQRLEETYQKDASMLGGIAPMALLARPGGFGAVAKLAENSTAYQRLMANPVTSRLFGGAVQGGMELGQERVEGQQPDWTRAGTAFGFGMVFNKPTRFGEALHGLGHFGGAATPEAAPAVDAAAGSIPTVAQAGDAKVMGPGITEDVFQGSHEQQPDAAMSAQDTARTEASLKGAPQPAPDLHAVARRLDPETFGAYDALAAQRDTFRARLAEAANPPDDVIADATAKRAALDAQLAEVPTSGAGRNLPEARRLRAQIRDAQRDIDALQERRTAFTEGRAQDTPEMATTRQHLMEVDYQMRDLSPQVASAYRMAADATASGTVPPVPLPEERPAAAAPAQFGSMAQMLADRGEGAPRTPQADTNAPGATEAPAPPTEGLGPATEPPAALGAPPPAATFDIAADIARQLVAAGRPEAEAVAAGKLAAARYQTRAARFKGALGTAEDVYRATAPELRGPDGRRIAGPPAAAPTPRVAPESTAPLMPTPERPTIGRAPSIEATATSQSTADLSPRPYGAPSGGLEALDPADIGVDATRFQFKAGGDASGVTERLQGVTTWDPRLAGTALVFRDADGKNWVADGHQRIGLAKRLAAEGQDGIRVNSFVLDAKDGVTDSQARAIAGMKNIAEGTGTAIDAAKVIREAKDTGADLPPLPPRSALVRDGQALARLGPDAFGMAVNEVVPTQQAAIVGRLVTDPLQQAEAMRVLAKTEPENLRQAELIVREIMATGTEEMTRQGGLFGDEHFASSIVLERAKIADEAMRQLKKDKATFGTLVAEAERIEGAGANALDRDANQGRLSTDEQAADLFTSFATHAGPVSDALSGIARRFKSGSISAAAAGREFLGALREAVQGRVDDGADPRGAVTGAAGERAGAESAFELAQGQPVEEVDPNQQAFFQSVNGKIRFTDGRRPLITLTKHADASTFVHETGHAWLEELMQDAAHPAAPDDVKADAQSVLNWLRVDGPADIKTRQHERFATGFEQYLREGVAPTPGLAGVFAKFRNWLVTIYQSLKGLGPEISPDIRGVFDRLIAAEPQRTVIATERDAPQSLAEVHEADARAIEPQDADAGADRVMAEAGRYIDEVSSEIAHEIQAAEARTVARQDGEGSGPRGTAEQSIGDPGRSAGSTGADDARGEAGAGPGAARQVDPDRGGPGAQPASSGLGERRGAELRGGSDAGPEGGGLPRREQRSDDGLRGGVGAQSADAGRIGQSLAPTPGTLFGDAASSFTDRAGNIRLDALTASEDVRQAIRDSAAENNGFIGDRRGVVTDGQVLDLADALGMDATKLNTRKIGQAFNAEQIVAARKLLIESATAVSDAMKRAAAGSDADVMAYAEAKDRHQLIQGQVAGITAEAGRALRAFRSLAGQEGAASVDQFIRQATGKTLFQLREEAQLGATLDSPSKVSKFMADAQKPSFGRMLLEYFVNNLISGPVTHVTYGIGNTILTANRMLLETPAAAAVGAARRALGGEEGVRFGEMAGQTKGALTGFLPAVQAGLDAYRIGATTLLPGENGPRMLPFLPNDLSQPASLDEHANLFSIVRGMRDGIVTAGGLLKAGASDLASGARDAPFVSAQYGAGGSIPDIAVRGVNVLPVGTLVRLPGRNVAAIHSFFRSMNYSIDKAGIAFRTAANEGLSGQAFAARVADIHTDPSEQVMDAARGTATDLTLMGQGGEFIRRLSKVIDWTPELPVVGEIQPLRFVDPFVKISANIMNQAFLERTPLGAVLAPEIRASLMGKNGPAAQDLAAGRMIVGSALGLTFGGLAAQGLITGSGPLGKDDEDTRNLQSMWRLAGNQAHSVRIGDVWYDVHRLGPLGMLMSVSADLAEIGQYASDGDMSKAGAAVMNAFAQNILDEGWAKGPSDLMQALENPGRYGPAYVRNQIQSFVPYSVALAQMDRASDPYTRQARTIMDGIKAKVPGWSEELFPRRDIWGDPIRNRDSLGTPYATAIYAQRISQDPVNQAMLDLGVHPAAVERKIRGVDLTDQQYDDYSRIAGRMTKMRLDTIVRSPDWQMWSPFMKHDAISAVITSCREAAAGVMMMKNPTIPAAAAAQRLAKLKGQ